MTTRTDTMGGIWADGAIDPPVTPVQGITYADSEVTVEELADGWPYRDPRVDSSKFNEAMRRVTALIQLCEKWGILPWHSAISYEQYALVLGADGSMYVALQPSTNQNPTTTNGYWIDPFLRHTNTFHVSFAARRNTALTITRENWTNLGGHYVRDAYNLYNPVSGKFVPQESGEYVLTCQTSIVGGNNATRLQAGVFVNGSLLGYGETWMNSTGNPSALAITRPVYMTSSDYAEGHIRYEDASPSPNATRSVNLQNYTNIFAGWRVA